MLKKRMIQVICIFLIAFLLITMIIVPALAYDLESMAIANKSDVIDEITEATIAESEELHPEIVAPRINTSEEHIKSAKEEEKKLQQKKEEEEQKRIAEEKAKEEAHWKNIGVQRITEYCPSCNSPAGTYYSSSGKRLQEGYVACNWLDNGTKIRIDGQVYTVEDYCGTDAIDLFRDTSDCHCDMNCYKEVFIYE